MPSDEAKISVVVPAFNRADALRKCIASLLNQTLDARLYEIIIVDNSSSDDTESVVRDCIAQSGHNIRYIFEPRRGLHFARHAGAKAAASDILAYTDDDVICDPRWLEELVNVFEDKEVGCAGGKILIQWDQEPPSWIIPYENVLGHLDYGSKKRALRDGEFINGGNFCIKRRVLWDLGGFNPDQIGEVLVGDGEAGLCTKIHKSGIKMLWVPDAVVWHRQNVRKNATLSDLKRRFRNNGVSSGYALYKEVKKRTRLLVDVPRSAFFCVRFKVVALLKRRAEVTNSYPSEFASAFYAEKAIYEFKLLIDKDLRELVTKENWLD
jgi:glycosyltransferase involved in cell wall biosynthesis